MPLFMCEQCGCVENTATGRYWTKDESEFWRPEDTGKALCSECAPRAFVDGTPTEFGKWHGMFPKRSALGMLIDQDGFLWSKSQVEAGLLPEHFRIVGEVTAAPQPPAEER